MHLGDDHAVAACGSGFEIPGSQRARVTQAGVAFAPNGLALASLYGAPAIWERTGRDEEIACGLLVEGGASGPDGVSKGGVFQQVIVPYLPGEGGVMADFPVDDRGNNQRCVFLAKGHLVSEADLFREFGNLGQGTAALGGG